MILLLEADYFCQLNSCDLWNLLSIMTPTFILLWESKQNLYNNTQSYLIKVKKDVMHATSFDAFRQRGINIEAFLSFCGSKYVNCITKTFICQFFQSYLTAKIWTTLQGFDELCFLVIFISNQPMQSSKWVSYNQIINS